MKNAIQSQSRRRTAVTVALLLASLSALVQAQAPAPAYPSRPVRMIIPFPAGGNTDITARPLAGKLAEVFGQTFLVDNRPGAGTIIGAEIAARATPDGHTLLFAAQNTLAINPATYRKLPYNVKRDFAPVAMLTDYNYVLAARVGFGPKTVPEMIALARANPGTISHGSIGEGSSGHMAQLLLESMAKVKLIHVPYKGNAPMITDLLGGQLDVALLGMASIQNQVKAGKIRLFAAASEKRMDEFPDLPTVAEAGYAGFTSGTWMSMVTQAAVPRAIILRLNREVNRALQSPEVKGPLESQKVTLGSGTPEDLAKRIDFETERWAKVAKEVNLVFD